MRPQSVADAPVRSRRGTSDAFRGENVLRLPRRFSRSTRSRSPPRSGRRCGREPAQSRAAGGVPRAERFAVKDYVHVAVAEVALDRVAVVEMGLREGLKLLATLSREGYEIQSPAKAEEPCEAPGSADGSR